MNVEAVEEKLAYLLAKKNNEKVMMNFGSLANTDPHGIVNKLFKPGVGGQKLVSLSLTMVNRIMQEFKFPEFMEFSNIVSIYKGKGECMDLENDSGIFVVNFFTSILMKMVYKDKYPTTRLPGAVPQPLI